MYEQNMSWSASPWQDVDNETWLQTSHKWDALPALYISLIFQIQAAAQTFQNTVAPVFIYSKHKLILVALDCPAPRVNVHYRLISGMWGELPYFTVLSDDAEAVPLQETGVEL